MVNLSGYSKKEETQCHIVYETRNGRYSVENKLLGKIVRSNVRSLENAQEYVGEAEGTLVADDQVGFLDDNGQKMRPSKKPGMKARKVGDIANGWTYLGGSVDGSLEDQYSIWKSGKGRFSLEKTYPERALLTGLMERELREALKKLKGTPGGNIAYQLSFPGF